MDKMKKFALLLGAIGFALIAALLTVLLCSKGFWGLVKWESLYRTVVIAVGALGLISLILGLFSSNKIVRRITYCYSSVMIVVGIVGLCALGALGARKPEAPSGLNIYSSVREPISDGEEISIAFGADFHWGNSNENEEERNKILSSVARGNHDLFVLCGDIVEYGFDYSMTDRALADLEKAIGDDLPVHFIMGNHDALINTDLNFNRFFRPEETSNNYVLTVASGVHIVVFDIIWDGDDVTDEELDWLTETLDVLPEEDTVILASHGFVYGSGYVTDGGGKWYDIEDVISRVSPILEEGGVDLMISGHQHSMELMEAGGVYYALAGPSGGSLFENYEVKTSAEQLFYEGFTYGYVTLDIRDGAITLAFRNSDGGILYEKLITAS